MIKILVEGMTEGKGGKETYIINIFRAFDKSKFLFSFISYNEKIAYQDELEAAGAEIIEIQDRSKGIFAYRKALSEMFRNNHFDVLWANKTTLSSCEVLEIAKSYEIPLRIIHSHSSSNMGGELTYVLHNINKLFVRKWANEYFACSEMAAGWFFGNKSCTLIKNGINVAKFRFDSKIRESVRHELGMDDNLVLGHVGRFGIEKNHKKLLNVFYEVHKVNSKTKLILCGDGEERAHIESQIHELGLEDSVVLMGVISNVNEVLQAMDLIVMPSLFEGLPFALIEAQAAGLKCIVSDTVSQESDILGWNSFLPLSDDDKVWANKIIATDVTTDKRYSAAEVIKGKGYDICDCVRQIENIIGKHIY